MRLTDEMPNHIREEEKRVYAELEEVSESFNEEVTFSPEEQEADEP